MIIDVISESLAIDFLKPHKANKERVMCADIWYVTIDKCNNL